VEEVSIESLFLVIAIAYGESVFFLWSKYFFFGNGLTDVEELSMESLFKVIAIAWRKFFFCVEQIFFFLAKAHRMWRRCPLRAYSK
jgi:hypothetical protein